MADGAELPGSGREREPRGVQTVETGLSLLSLLTEGEPLTAAELSRRAGLSKGQTHAYLVSFQTAGLIARNPESGRYGIGRFGLELGAAHLAGFDPQQVASEEAQKLADSLGQRVSLSVWGSYGPTVTAVHEGSERIRINARPGTVYSVTGTATGRLFAALLPAGQVGPVARAQAQEPPPGRYVGQCPGWDEVQDGLTAIRQSGISVTYSWPQPGISAIAAPVRNFSGRLDMAVTLIGAAEEIDIAIEGRHVQELVWAAARISHRLGCCPPPP
ncbi:IclR family transcriptional regulator [Mangrovicoccus sp. HB161399]|uniref:IclR family transcriptional regulator n=1 Tax=Mangrovicoccus sp. HB161399 TaxID=2720392 RepID=UPI001556E792|nr:IclR family transcriptional regulator [Mangrovicoccus sp. HB161399]